MRSETTHPYWLAALLAVAGGCGEETDAEACLPGSSPRTVELDTRQRSQLLGVQSADAGLVAVRDGDDPSCPWQVVAGSGTGTYELAVTHERYVVAVACTDPSLNPVVEVFARSAADDAGGLSTTCAARLGDDGVPSVSFQVEAAAPAGIQGFVLDEASEKYAVDGATVTVSWKSHGGPRDLVVFARPDLRDEPPSDLFVVRDLVANDDVVVNASPGTAPYAAFGPAGTMTASEPVSLVTRFVTRNGTRAPLGEAYMSSGPTAGTFATWPVALIDPGDAYEQVATSVASSDGIDTVRIAQRFTLEPSGFAPVLPPPIDPATTLVLDGDAGTLEHATLPDATLYALACSAADHALVFNISAGWHAAETDVLFELPTLPEELPVAARTLRGCAWELTAVGSTGGLSTELQLSSIGVVAGAPAQLVGTERWLSRRELGPGVAVRSR